MFELFTKCELLQRWTFTSSWSPSNVKQKESKNKLLVYYSPVVIPEDDWPTEDAPSSFQGPGFLPTLPTLPDWINDDFRTCISNLFPRRSGNHFDTLEQCFENTDRDDFHEAVNCAYCGLTEENRDFMYAFCNATGTLQEDQVLTCEDYDQLRSSISTKNPLPLSEEGDDNTINISWTTGEHH